MVRRHLTAGILAALSFAACADSDPEVRFLRSTSYTFSWAERRAINRTAAAATLEARRYWPDLPPVIFITARTGPDVIPETGETGTALPPASIVWTVDPGHEGGVRGVVDAWLRPSLLHEFHHLVRSEIGVPQTIVDRAVFEGSATVFERDSTGVRPPWGDYPPEVEQWAIELLDVPGDASVRDWIYKHPDGRRWIGMKVGAYWTDRAMAASGKSAAELALAPTEEILRLAGAHK